MPSPTTQYHVSGLVAEGGKGLAGATVTLFWQQLRNRATLATGQTDADGNYSLTYAPPADQKGKILVLAEAKTSTGDNPVDSKTYVIAPEMKINLDFQPDGSEYTGLLLALTPQLGAKHLTDLAEDEQNQDVSFLARQISQPSAQVMRMVTASMLEAAQGLAAPVFYAFLRLEIPNAIPGDLLTASDNFKAMPALLTKLASLIFTLSADTQRQTLETAIARKLIAAGFTAQLPAILQQLEAKRYSNALSKPYGTGTTPLGQLLALSSLTGEQPAALAQALLTNTAPMSAFWSTLSDGRHGFTTAEAASAQRVMELGSLVESQVPVVKTLLERFQAGTSKTIEDLAGLSKSDWETIVTQSGAGAAPAGVTVQDFAAKIYTTTTEAYPTAALASRIDQGTIVPVAQRASLTAFFANNPDLNLLTANVDVYLAQEGAKAFTGIAAADQADTIANVKRFQRVLQICASVDTAQALLGLGLDSAAKIAMMGQKQFFAKASTAGISQAESNEVYANAEHLYATAVSLISQNHSGLTNVWPAALGNNPGHASGIPAAVKTSPSLRTLFGPQDFCAVDEATSVLSPAAYLTDLLMWLRRRNPAGAYATLRNRRPDIALTVLNAANTFTELPYIDVVNELLEDAVAPPKPAVRKTTMRTAAELRAAPEYVNSEAYAALAQASFPHQLPYERNLDMLRTALRQAGVTLWQVRQALKALHSDTVTAQSLGAAAERFQIGARELQLITQANAVPVTAAWGTANPSKDMASVPVFLQQSGLKYEQLLELVRTTWPWTGGKGGSVTGINDDCDTTGQTISPMDDAGLDRIHRFLRFWRHCGWQMWELDLVLGSTGVGAGALDAAGLSALFAFRQILDATKLGVAQAAAFFGNIDTSTHRGSDGLETVSLYAQLFLNPTVPADAALNLAAMGSANPPAKIMDHLSSIGAALQVTAADAATLAGLTDGNLTLENLSLMYRLALLAGTTGLAISNLAGAFAIEGLTIAQVFASPASTLDFIDRATAARKTGFTVPALTYVLSTAPTSAGQTLAQLTTVLTSVQSAMQAVQGAIFKTTNPPTTIKAAVTVLQTELAQLPAFADPMLLANAIAIVNGSFSGTPAQSAAVTAGMETFMTPGAAAAALYLPLTSDPTNLAATQSEVSTRALAILVPLAVSLTRTEVVAAVSSGLQLKADVTSLLLSQVNVPGTSVKMLASLTDSGLIAPGQAPYANALTPGNFPNQFAALRLLDKIAAVVTPLGLVSADVSWLLANATGYGGLDLTQLPVLPAQPSIPTGKLAQTVLAVQLNRAFSAAANSTATPPPAVQSLFSLISGVAAKTLATGPAIQSALAGITGWAAADIADLAAVLGVSSESTSDYLNPVTYDRLRTLIGMAEQAGGTGRQLAAWGAPGIGEAAAQSAMQALKSKYTEQAWLKIAPKIANPIRERSNAALRSFLIAQRDAQGNPVWAADDDGLCDRFLIDVQMSSCEATSRIVQAYASVQMFVQRCLMNLEPGIVADPETDDGWLQWDWMQRFQLWVANRKIFLYPENWLVATERPNRSELFDSLAQAAHQQENVAENLEAILLDYLNGLDGVARLRVTGICTSAGKTYVVARTVSDPPAFYLRTLQDNIWTPWVSVPLSINAHQVTPEVYGNNLYLFWPQISSANEPQQSLPKANTTDTNTPSPPPATHVEISLGFSVLRNGKWAPIQMAKYKLYDMPLISAESVSHGRAIESLYTLKTVVNASWLYLDVFRLGGGRLEYCSPAELAIIELELLAMDAGGKGMAFDLGENRAVHVGRAVFDGRFNDLLQRNLPVIVGAVMSGNVLKPPQGAFLDYMLTRAQAYYGPDARHLLPLAEKDAAPNLPAEPGLEPREGAMTTVARGINNAATIPLTFTSEGALEQNYGPLLKTATLPFRVVGPNTFYSFVPHFDFVFSDNQRSYFVHPAVDVEKANRFRIDYSFSRFYHPYTGLFWHELSSGGVNGLYDPRLQSEPGKFGAAEAFSFTRTYSPLSGRTTFDGDAETVDFSANAAFSVYNWELFYHVPLYIAQLLSQNQQFEEARKWFHYIFNPTMPGKDPIPQRYWIPKPLHDLTSPEIQQQSIGNLLQLVGDNNKAADAQVTAWRNNPYDPYLVADQRPVAYMKNVFMSYLDNLIAWADYLFSSESREALNEATLLYVLASEILGPRPQAVTPPAAVEQSFDDLLPKLDAFADGLAEIENVVPKAVRGRKPGAGRLQPPETFYFKVPPNDKLLGYWDTLADRLYKLRHCQNLQGGALDLALFDKPIDPGMLTGGGTDNSSVLNDVASPLPNYRFATCYAQAMDFCSAVRAYGTSLQAALEKSDADELAVLLATTQKQLLAAANQMFQWKVDQAQTQIDSLNQALQLAQSRYDYYSGLQFMNSSEKASNDIGIALNANTYAAAAIEFLGACAALIPDIVIGASGFGASPVATTVFDAGHKQATLIAAGNKTVGTALDNTAKLVAQQGTYTRRQEGWQQSAAEAQIQIDQTKAQLAGAQLALQMAELDQRNHQLQMDNLQQQIDLLTNRFTNKGLYDWMVSQLSGTYFQSYRLAYAMAKRAEACYRYELGLRDSSFISFGYWDSLKKGLLSGEALNHDLRRMQASYLDLNVRRFEISRVISLSAVAPDKLFALLETGSCDFDLPEALFDGDYPGHYQRRITRVSVTVVYPSPGKNDNVKCTLTLVKNSVRLNNDLNPQYPRVTAAADPRFTDAFGAVQSIVTGNAQDDPGLFITAIASNIADQRYLPFEGAGCISSWHLELPGQTNDIDLTTVGDVLIHLYYTALDGGSQFKQAALQALPVPTQGVKLFSVQNDFGAAPAAYAPVVAQGPVATPWQAFFLAATPPTDQEFVLKVTAAKFPNWTRGKTINITGLTVYVLSQTPGGSWVLQPQAPLPTADVTLSPISGYPGVAAGTVALAADTAPGTWTFKLKASTAADWQSLKSTQLGDMVLMVNFTAN
jgi:hypothetical protein